MIFWLKKIYCHFKYLAKKQAGLSLMEIVVVLAVFSTMSLLVTDVFITVSRTQIQTSSSQKVQSDARFAMEAIAREIKFGTIDYQCYADYIDPDVTGCEELDQTVEKIKNLVDPVAILVTRDQENNQIFYGFLDSKIRACSNTRVDPKRCYRDDPKDKYINWQDVTPKDVVVENLKFYISPESSPFSKEIYCEVDDDCDLLNYCDSDEKKCDIPDIQPRVTILMSTKSKEEGARGEQIILQTSVSTMRYLR